MGRRMISPEMVGRKEELDQLAAAAERVAAGSSAVVLLSGEAGVGKTRTVSEFVRRTRERGLDCLVGGCVEFGDQELPLAPLVEILRGLRRDLDEEAFFDRLGDHGRELLEILPEERRDAGTTKKTELGWLMGGTFAWLEDLAAGGPLVVVVEDMHWADQSTRDLLSYVARSLPGQVMLLLTYRSDEMRRRHPLRPMLASMERVVRPERILVEPLTETETGELLDHIVEGTVERRFVADVHRRTEGNPFFIEELVAAPGVEVPESLRDVLLVRADAAGPEAVDLLSIAAVGGSAVDVACLEHVSGGPADGAGAQLQALVDIGLLVSSGDSLRFRHELVREVFAEELMAGEATRVHRAYAEYLEADDPDAFGEIARHWQHGGNADRALPASVAAARAAAAAGTPGEALGHFERALDLAVAVDGGLERLGLTAEALMLEAAVQAGQVRQFSRAAELARRAALTLEATDVPNALTAWVATVRYLADGRLPGEEIVLSRALELAPSKPSAARAWLLALKAIYLVKNGDNTRAIEVGRVAIEDAEAVGERAALAHVLSTLSAAEIGVNDRRGLETLERARSAAEACDDRHASARASINEAASNLWLGRYAENLELCPVAFERSKLDGTVGSCGPVVLYNLLEAQVTLGEWNGAAVTADAIRRVVGEDDESGLMTWWWPLWPAVLARQGRGDEAADLMDAMAPHVSGDHCPEGLGLATALQLELAAAADELPDMSDAVDAALDEVVPDWLEAAAQVAAAACQYEAERSMRAKRPGSGDGTREPEDNARRWLSRVREAVIESPYDGTFTFPTISVWLAQADAELARLLRRPAPADWLNVAARWRDLGVSYQVAYTLMRAAEAALLEDVVDGGTRTQAAEMLRESRDLAAGMAARPLVEAVESLARRARVEIDEGAGSENLDPSSEPFGLTKRELEVLALVADGLSNGQVGARLFISTKTASVHVSNILRKLGAVNRIEAASIATRNGLTDVSHS